MTLPSPLHQHGCVWPLTVPVSLSWAELGAILWLIHEHGVRSFLELGIEQGGLASLLLAREVLDTSFRYYGMELDVEKVDPRLRRRLLERPRVKFTDIFSREGRSYLEYFISNAPKPLLVFCDDGDKPREVDLISELLPSGNFILAHDYPVEFKETDRPSTMRQLWRPILDGTRLFFMEKYG